MQMAERVNASSGLCVEFLADGSDAFASIRKSYGLFSNVRSMLLMKGDRGEEHLHEKVGYYGEELVLDLTDLGLGTCWVGGTFDKTKFTVPDGEKIICAILVGKVPNETFKEKLIHSVLSKKRKPASERLVTTANVTDWMVAGIEAVRLAPSAVNTQKPTFRYDGKELTADVPESYEMDLVDLGIAKKHFEIEAGGKFDLGNGSRFRKLSDTDEWH